MAKSVSQYGTKRLAKDIEKESTVSYADVAAVLNALPHVISRYLAEGYTVKIDGIGTFYLSLQCKKTDVDSADDVSADQITNVKVQLRPEMESATGKGRKVPQQNSLVSNDIEWIYLPAAPKADDEKCDGSEGGNGEQIDDEG